MLNRTVTFRKTALPTQRRQRGQGMSEYIVIVALIAVVSIGVFASFGEAIRHQVAGLAAALSGDGGKVTTALKNSAAAAADAETKAAVKHTMSDYDSQNHK